MPSRGWAAPSKTRRLTVGMFDRQKLVACSRDRREASVLDAVTYHDVTSKNDFDQKSIYRGTPSPDVEEAWAELWKRLYNPCFMVADYPHDH